MSYKNKPVLVSDIFSISEAHIPRTLYVLKKKMKSNPKSDTIKFKTGGRVSLGLLIHYTTLSISHFIFYKLNFLVLILWLNIYNQKYTKTGKYKMQSPSLEIVPKFNIFPPKSYGKHNYFIN